MRLEYFQMIDRVLDIKLEDPSIRMEARVPTTSTVFEGHFPGYPLMPAVLLIETIAQTAGLLILARIAFARIPILAAVKSAKVRRQVSPGDILIVEARVLHEGSGFAVAKGAISVAEKPTCEAELTYRILPFPDPKVRAELELVAAQVGLRLGALNDAG
jgi:3-hydroxyacyl-[acyl-carrier-protein] dehydratase